VKDLHDEKHFENAQAIKAFEQSAAASRASSWDGATHNMLAGPSCKANTAPNAPTTMGPLWALPCLKPTTPPNSQMTRNAYCSNTTDASNVGNLSYTTKVPIRLQVAPSLRVPVTNPLLKLLSWQPCPLVTNPLSHLSFLHLRAFIPSRLSSRNCQSCGLSRYQCFHHSR
jgi:hypothetical protein